MGHVVGTKRIRSRLDNIEQCARSRRTPGSVQDYMYDLYDEEYQVVEAFLANGGDPAEPRKANLSLFQAVDITPQVLDDGSDHFVRT